MAEALFLDRDGVINADSRDFIKSIAEWIPLPGSLHAIARLCEAGYRIVVVTNQSGIARGLFGESVLEEIHAHMNREIEAVGGRLAGIYYCPHGPDEGCGCRKPAPGLIHRACADLGLEAELAPLIGDRVTDVAAARAAGCRPILVRSGLQGPDDIDDAAWREVEIFEDLAEAAQALICHGRHPSNEPGR